MAGDKHMLNQTDNLSLVIITRVNSLTPCVETKVLSIEYSSNKFVMNPAVFRSPSVSEQKTNGGKHMKNQTLSNTGIGNEQGPQRSMRITKEQAKYWYRVAKKDIQDGNLDGARNVHRWLLENKAWYHARFLGNLLRTQVRP